jgi:DNA-binding NarL/FixJ family response regulator
MAAYDTQKDQHTEVAVPTPTTLLVGRRQDVAADRISKPRVVLADDSQRMREAVIRVLRVKCEVELVGFAFDGWPAIDAVHRLQPDILLLDILMPALDGIKVTRMLRKADSLTKIIFLTGIEDPSFQQAAMEAGAQAYVFKTQLLTDLPRAIAAVMAGETFLSSRS